MKVILDVKDNRGAFFMELLRSLDYVEVIREIKDKRKNEAIRELAEAFNDARLHEKGKKKLKTAKQALDEL